MEKESKEEKRIYVENLRGYNDIMISFENLLCELVTYLIES